VGGEGVDVLEGRELNDFFNAVIQHEVYSIIRYNYIASTLIKGWLSVHDANSSIHL
jgi:hypothetical protein